MFPTSHVNIAENDVSIININYELNGICIYYKDSDNYPSSE